MTKQSQKKTKKKAMKKAMKKTNKTDTTQRTSPKLSIVDRARKAYERAAWEAAREARRRQNALAKAKEQADRKEMVERVLCELNREAKLKSIRDDRIERAARGQLKAILINTDESSSLPDLEPKEPPKKYPQSFGELLECNRQRAYVEYLSSLPNIEEYYLE
jgi:hypothetical protein